VALGIRERAFLLGGNLDIEGIEGAGTTVALAIPNRLQGRSQLPVASVPVNYPYLENEEVLHAC
jgi:phosphoribosylcarboxyaminoimidazole (NCAIR) mutase